MQSWMSRFIKQQPERAAGMLACQPRFEVDLHVERSCSNLSSAWERRCRFSNNEVINGLTSSNWLQCLSLWVVQRFPVTWTHLCIWSSCMCSDDWSLLSSTYVWTCFYIDFDFLSMSTWYKNLCAHRFLQPHCLTERWCYGRNQFIAHPSLSTTWELIQAHRWAKFKVGAIELCVECLNYTPEWFLSLQTALHALMTHWPVY